MKKKKSEEYSTSSSLFALGADSEDEFLKSAPLESFDDEELRPLDELEKIERQNELDAIQAEEGFMDMLKDL